MPRNVINPAVAGATGLVAPHILIPLWHSAFAVLFVPLVIYLRQAHQVNVRELSFDLAGLIDGLGGTILGTVVGFLLATALRPASWFSWVVFALCFVASCLMSGAAAGDVEAGWWLVLRPLMFCFIMFSALGFGLMAGPRRSLNAP